MLRVYVKGVLEVAIYTPFNIASLLNLNSHSALTLGVTASTSDDLSNDHQLSNFALKVARPNIIYSSASIR